MSARAGLASPGLLLRGAREARGLSIEEVADRLRLNVALVLAMEEDKGSGGDRTDAPRQRLTQRIASSSASGA